jgi:peptide/nickel transport system permease protein
VLRYVVYRLALFIPVLFAISVVSFAIINLPPGDYVTQLAAERAWQGGELTAEQQAALRDQYGLSDPIYVRYVEWIGGIVFEGDFGRSLSHERPVVDILVERVPMTITISLASLIFIYAVSIPIGIYAATHKYSLVDYLFTLIGFIGIAIPGFLLALLLLWVFYWIFDLNMSGLFSPQYVDAPWSWGRLMDLASRVWFPVVIIGMSGTAGLIRVMRGNLLDELEKPYVIAARAKGIPEGRLLFRYPVRIAINPIVSTIGWILPALVGGEVLVSIVLNLQTTGPVLLSAVLAQDGELAASITFILSVLTVAGTLVADLLLAWLDPRIRLGEAVAT